MMLERNCRCYLVTAEEPGYFEVSVMVEHCISPLTEDKKSKLYGLLVHDTFHHLKAKKPAG